MTKFILVSSYKSHSNISRRVTESTKHCFKIKEKERKKEKKERKKDESKTILEKLFTYFIFFFVDPLFTSIRFSNMNLVYHILEQCR